jgi:nickel transport protein
MKHLLLCLALLSCSAWGHEIKLELSQQAAAVVQLAYADGQPFAFEAYELYHPNKEVPEQVGRTNGEGQIVFLPGTRTDWRLKAVSADGHGVDQILKVSIAATDGNHQPCQTTGLPRTLLLVVGLGILFGLFGVVQLFLRKKQP